MNIFLGETENLVVDAKEIERKFKEAFNEAHSAWYTGEAKGNICTWTYGDLIPALEKRGLVITTRDNYNAHKIY